MDSGLRITPGSRQVSLWEAANDKNAGLGWCCDNRAVYNDLTCSDSFLIYIWDGGGALVASSPIPPRHCGVLGRELALNRDFEGRVKSHWRRSRSVVALHSPRQSAQPDCALVLQRNAEECLLARSIKTFTLVRVERRKAQNCAHIALILDKSPSVFRAPKTVWRSRRNSNLRYRSSASDKRRCYLYIRDSRDREKPMRRNVSAPETGLVVRLKMRAQERTSGDHWIV
jgi:hypothetical protein